MMPADPRALAVSSPFRRARRTPFALASAQAPGIGAAPQENEYFAIYFHFSEGIFIRLRSAYCHLPRPRSNAAKLRQTQFRDSSDDP